MWLFCGELDHDSQDITKHVKHKQAPVVFTETYLENVYPLVFVGVGVSQRHRAHLAFFHAKSVERYPRLQV